MRAPTVLSDGTQVDYGLGTRLGELQGHRIFGHTGNGGGFNNVLEYYPDDDLTIVVLINSDSSVTALTIAGRIARSVLNIPPTTISEHPLSEGEIISLSGKFESAEGTSLLFGDQGHIRVKFTENRPVLSFGISRKWCLRRRSQHYLQVVHEKWPWPWVLPSTPRACS